MFNVSKNTPTPNIVAETFVSVCKYFLIVLVLNNLIWAVIHFRPVTSRLGDTHVEITQTGNEDISQKINS